MWVWTTCLYLVVWTQGFLVALALAVREPLNDLADDLMKQPSRLWFCSISLLTRGLSSLPHPVLFISPFSISPSLHCHPRCRPLLLSYPYLPVISGPTQALLLQESEFSDNSELLSPLPNRGGHSPGHFSLTDSPISPGRYTDSLFLWTFSLFTISYLITSPPLEVRRVEVNEIIEDLLPSVSAGREENWLQRADPLDPQGLNSRTPYRWQAQDTPIPSVKWNTVCK